MKKLLFISILFSICGTAAFAQKKYMDVLYWQFKNTTGQAVDGITIEHIEGTAIQKISIGTASFSPPIGTVILPGDGQKQWQACNFGVELANNGIVKLDVKNSPDPGIGVRTVLYFWTRNGQKVGDVMSAQTTLTGFIPTQLGS